MDKEKLLIGILAAKIMIVDDDMTNIAVMVKALKEEGFRHIWKTQDPRNAAALYREIKPNLVVLDLSMPYLDGFEVIEQIKAIEPTYSPILVMSGDLSQETRLKALRNGARDFISKPFNHSEAIARIRNMLEIEVLYKRIRLQNNILGQQNQRLLHGMQVLQDYSRRLKATESHFRNLYERAPLPYQLLDSDGKIIEVNPAWEALFGRSRREVLGLSFSDLIKSPSQSSINTLFADFQKAGYLSSPPFETTHFKTGEPIFIELKGVSEYDEHGKFLQGHCNVIDITSRIRAEAAREALINQLRISASVFESIRDGVLITDARNRIIDVNPAFTEISGYEREEVLGRDPKCLGSGMTSPAIYRELWRSIEQCGFWRGELINRRKNGEIYAETVTITVVRDSDNNLSHYVAVINNINPLRNDILTGLPSRHVLSDRLTRAMETARLNDYKVALIMLGIDRLKAINEALGHFFGDVLLREVSRRLAEMVPQSATLSRLRGDEFTIIIGDLEDMIPLENLVQSILDASTQVHKIDNEVIRVSFSLGITVYPDDTQDLEELFRNADLAMRAAKARGGGCYQYFRADMQVAALERKRLYDHLHQACRENQFFLLYQPIMDLQTGIVRKAETLIRWRHPERGLVSPAHFIPAAEETGLIIPISHWIVQEAMARVETFRRYQTDFQLSINISPVQLMDEKFPMTDYAALLTQHRVPGSALVLEITEGLFLDSNPWVQQQLLTCRASAIQLAIDDFGTGYSALSYLSKFNIDYIKIDQSFVRTLEPDSKQFALCEAIVIMAHKLGLKVIAEGIETIQQRVLLEKIGCDFGQGYLISKPISASELEQLLKSQSLLQTTNK